MRVSTRGRVVQPNIAAQAARQVEDKLIFSRISDLEQFATISLTFKKGGLE